MLKCLLIGALLALGCNEGPPPNVQARVAVQSDGSGWVQFSSAEPELHLSSVCAHVQLSCRGLEPQTDGPYCVEDLGPGARRTVSFQSAMVRVTAGVLTEQNVRHYGGYGLYDILSSCQVTLVDPEYNR